MLANTANLCSQQTKNSLARDFEKLNDVKRETIYFRFFIIFSYFYEYTVKKYTGVLLVSSVLLGGIATAAITPIPTISNTFSVAGQTITAASINKLAEAINLLDVRTNGSIAPTDANHLVDKEYADKGTALGSGAITVLSTSTAQSNIANGVQVYTGISFSVDKTGYYQVAPRVSFLHAAPHGYATWSVTTSSTGGGYYLGVPGNPAPINTASGGDVGFASQSYAFTNNPLTMKLIAGTTYYIWAADHLGSPTTLGSLAAGQTMSALYLGFGL